MPINTIEETVVASLENVKPAKGGMINLVFGKTVPQTFGTETINLDIYDGKRGEAGYTARGATGQTLGIEGWDTIVVTPPLINEGYVVSARDLAVREFGKGNVNTEKRQQAKFQQHIDRQEQRRQNRKIRAYNAQVISLITTGKVTIVEMDDKGKSKASRTVDFNMPPSHIYTVPVAWDDATAKIFKDMEDLDEEINKASGLKPDYAIVGKNTIYNILANEEVQKLIDNRRINLGDLVKEDKGDGLVYWGHLAGKDIYTFEEFKEDGTPLVPADAYIAGSTMAELDILHGSIDTIIDGEPRIVEAEEIFYTKVDEDSVTKKFNFVSARLYALTQAGAFGCLTTN